MRYLHMKKSPSASLGQNAIYKGILNAFNLLVPLFVGPYIAGLLSPELYGIYNRVYACLVYTSRCV